MQYQDMNDEILKVDIKEDINTYWKEKKAIPLLMKNMYHEYEEGIVPLKDTFAYKINKNIHTHMLIVGKTGRQKTVMMKNMIRGYWRAGYKILFIEPKSMDMVYG